jgi:hypothetical protein
MFSMSFNARLDTWTAASVQRCLGSCGESDRHPQCDGEVTLRCQQELHTQGLLGDTTSKNPEGTNVVSVETMQWVRLYLSIGHMIRVTENISHSTAETCRSPLMHVLQLNRSWHILSAITQKCPDTCWYRVSFGTWNLFPKFVCTFHLHTYVHSISSLLSADRLTYWLFKSMN